MEERGKSECLPLENLTKAINISIIAQAQARPNSKSLSKVFGASRAESGPTQTMSKVMDEI